MTVYLNLLFQLFATILQYQNQVTSFVPEGWRPVVAGLLGILQGIIAIWAHFRNPNGTPATEPYKK